MAKPERDRAVRLTLGAVAGTATVPMTKKYVDPRVPSVVFMGQPASTLVGVLGGLASLLLVSTDRIKDNDTADAALVAGVGLMTNGIMKWTGIPGINSIAAIRRGPMARPAAVGATGVRSLGTSATGQRRPVKMVA